MYTAVKRVKLFFHKRIVEMVANVTALLIVFVICACVACFFPLYFFYYFF